MAKWAMPVLGWSKAPSDIAQSDWDKLREDYDALPQKRRYRGICYMCGKRRILRYYSKIHSAECQWCQAKFVRRDRHIRKLRKILEERGYFQPAREEGSEPA